MSGCGGRSVIDLPPGHLTVSSASTLDFGLTDCGAGSSALVVTVSNDEASSAVHWTATLDGPFAFDGPSSGVLTEHDSASVVLHAVVPSSSVAGVPVDGALRFESDGTSRPPVVVPLRVTPQGAMLRLESLPLAFGDIPISSTSPWLAATVVNDGNVPADIAIAAPSDPQFLLGTKSLWLPAGAKNEIALRFAPTVTGPVTGSVTADAKAPRCGAPATVLLQGVGTKGVVLTSPGSLDFGLVDCGTTAAPKTASVENKGDGPFDFSAYLTTGASFTVTPSSGTVPPGATVEVVVTPSGIPSTSAVTADLYADTLTLTTNVPDDVAHVIPLHETARGAILTFPASVAPGRSPVDGGKSVPFPISNTGNIAVTVSASSAGNVLSVPPTVVPPGGIAVAGVVEVRADAAKLAQNDAQSFSLVANGPLCGVSSASVTGVVHAYDTALDVDADGGTFCIVGHTRRVYCTCTDDCLALGISAYAAPVLIPNVSAEQVMVGVHGVCYRNGAQLDCTAFGPGPVQKFSITLPSDWTGVWGGIGPVGFHGCVTAASGQLRCFGESGFGQWGDGTLGHDPCYTTLSDAMTGATPITAYSAGWAGFALRNGEVLAAGSWVGNELGNAQSNTPTAMVPVTVDGVHDAVAVAAMNRVAGACAVRANGAVVCWGDGHIAAAERGGFTDAATILPLSFEVGWALRTTGELAAWQGASNVAVPGSFHLPIVKLKGNAIAYNFGPAATFAIEAGGEVTELVNGQSSHRVVGFEGP